MINPMRYLGNYNDKTHYLVIGDSSDIRLEGRRDKAAHE